MPLLSYRTAAGCAGLKSSHWWAVLYRTKVLLSNRRGSLKVTVTLPSFLTFMMILLSSVWLDLSLFHFFPPSIKPIFVSFSSPFFCLFLSYLYLFIHPSILECFFHSSSLSVLERSDQFNQATLDKMSSRVLLEFTQVHDFLQLSVLMRAL